MSSSTKLKIESPKGSQTLLLSASETRLRLSDLLRRHHLPLNTRCGQRGLCDGCIVELVAGKVIHHVTGETLAPQSQPVAIRGCEYRLAETSARIHIPSRALLSHEPQVVSDFKINVPRAHDPLWSDSKTATPTSTRNLGAAIDIGTTTVALLLVDLSNGEIVATASDFNHQMHFGDDVLTRINLCASDPTMLRQLQDAIVKQTVEPLLREVLAQAKANTEALRCLTVAANTTMLHLFAGADPTPMGHAPFTPVFVEHRALPLAMFPFSFVDDRSQCAVHLLPSAAAYVGADLTAGIFSSGQIYDEGPSLLVDAGTNGEIILKHGGRLLGCATAAGPAFEGAGLTNGIRACHGAISHVRFSRNPFTLHTEVIGNTKPIGICGSAYVDLLAEGRRWGVLSGIGRIEDAASIRIAQDGYAALRIAKAQGNRDIIVTEVDIARLLQAKAAIAAGILTLLARENLKPADIKTLYLAGGFGLHMNVENAIACGLLPGLRREQVQLVGNTSLAGAYLALLDRGALDEMIRISPKIEIVELNLDPNFESRYIDQLSLADVCA